MRLNSGVQVGLEGPHDLAQHLPRRLGRVDARHPAEHIYVLDAADRHVAVVAADEAVSMPQLFRVWSASSTSRTSLCAVEAFATSVSSGSTFEQALSK